MKFKHNKALISLAIFSVCFAGYMANVKFDFDRNLTTHQTRRLMTSSDLAPNTFMPYLILKYGTLNFEPILGAVKQFDNLDEDPYYLHNLGGKYYSVYPVLTGISGIPFFALPMILNKIPNVDSHLNVLKVLLLGRVTAAFYSSVSCVLFYWILEALTKEDKRWKIIMTFFYAFGTTTWSISSRGMWMHTLSQVFVSLAILFVILGAINEENKNLIKWSGLILGFAVLTKPTNIILAAAISLFILLYRRDVLKDFVLLSLPAAVLMFGYNWAIYGSPFVEGYAARNDLGWNTSLFESIPGFLFSPARSFLFISPPLVLAYYGIVKNFVKVKKNDLDKLLMLLGLTFLLAMLMFGKWWAWSGANGFGYRMLTEFLPIVGIFTYLVSKNFTKLGKTIVILLIIYSFYVHFNAVVFRKSRCDYEHNWSFYCLAPPKEAPQY